jgi:hypothetical protein
MKTLIPRAIRLSHGGVLLYARWFALSPQKALAGGPTLQVLAAKIISGRRSPPAHITKHCIFAQNTPWLPVRIVYDV